MRVFIVDEVAGRIAFRLLASRFHGHAVVGRVLDDGDAVAAQFVLLPLPRVGRHVDGGTKAQARAHDADRQTQVARRADGDRILAEKRPYGVAGQQAVIIAVFQQTRVQRQHFRVFQHFIDAAARLDRAGNGQMAILLEP
ncbi:hypothetical protein D3C85_951370 [compost metagenome]